MARNEVEVFFDTVRQRHQDEAATLLTQQAKFIRIGDLNRVDTLAELVQAERGRIRFLDQFVPNILDDLRSQGIKILEVEETAQVAAPQPVQVTEVVSAAEEEKIPETFIAPDGTELVGETGKLVAFLAHRGTFKDRPTSTAYMYGSQDPAARGKISALIGYVRKEESSTFKHGVRIETIRPSPQEKRHGARVKDRAVVVETTASLQAAVLADVALTAFETNLGQADINTLEQIRQPIGVIGPELKSRLTKEAQSLVLRFLADKGGVHDELDKEPGSVDTLIALSYFTPLAQDSEESLNQLFKE